MDSFEINSQFLQRYKENFSFEPFSLTKCVLSKDSTILHIRLHYSLTNWFFLLLDMKVFFDHLFTAHWLNEGFFLYMLRSMNAVYATRIVTCNIYPMGIYLQSLRFTSFVVAFLLWTYFSSTIEIKMFYLHSMHIWYYNWNKSVMIDRMKWSITTACIS